MKRWLKISFFTFVLVTCLVCFLFQYIPNHSYRKNQTIKVVIFDLDGVVFKSLDDQGKFLWSINLEKDLGLSLHHCHKIYALEWNDVIRGHLETKEHLERVFRDPLFQDLKITPEDYIDYWLSHDSFLDYEMLRFVDSLPVPCYIGTNQDRHRTEYINKMVGGSFVDCFSSYQIGAIKPEPMFYEYIEKALGVPSSQLLLIDDTHANVEGARRRGWHGYHYKGDMDDLKNVVQELFRGA